MFFLDILFHRTSVIAILRKLTIRPAVEWPFVASGVQMQRLNDNELRLFLSGWKEIASYLGMGVRTVQRYEREMRLPIHRPTGKSHGTVIATKAELDGWLTAGATQINSRPRAVDNRTNRIGADFLRVDSQIALTLSGMALAARDPEKRRRTAEIARKAYDTITQLRQKIVLSSAQRGCLDANLQRLKSELQSIGQRF